MKKALISMLFVSLIMAAFAAAGDQVIADKNWHFKSLQEQAVIWGKAFPELRRNLLFTRDEDDGVDYNSKFDDSTSGYFILVPRWQKLGASRSEATKRILAKAGISVEDMIVEDRFLWSTKTAESGFSVVAEQQRECAVVVVKVAFCEFDEVYNGWQILDTSKTMSGLGLFEIASMIFVNNLANQFNCGDQLVCLGDETSIDEPPYHQKIFGGSWFSAIHSWTRREDGLWEPNVVFSWCAPAVRLSNKKTLFGGHKKSWKTSVVLPYGVPLSTPTYKTYFPVLIRK